METENQWRALCSVAGRADWPRRFPDMESRKAAETDLDSEIASWTEVLDRGALAERLAAAGVMAAPVLDGLEVAAEAGLRARGAIVEVDHPEVGRWPQSAVPCRFSKSPARVRSAAPLKGEDSMEVFGKLLDMERAEYRRLEQRKVTGVAPPKNVRANEVKSKAKAG